jgi:hypothetical protein
MLVDAAIGVVKDIPRFAGTCGGIVRGDGTYFMFAFIVMCVKNKKSAACKPNKNKSPPILSFFLPLQGGNPLHASTMGVVHPQ